MNSQALNNCIFVFCLCWLVSALFCTVLLKAQEVGDEQQQQGRGRSTGSPASTTTSGRENFLKLDERSAADEDLLKDEDKEVHSEILSDPRLGECTIDELKQIENHFSNETVNQCRAYSCIDEKFEEFYELLPTNDEYVRKYSAQELTVIANLFSACWCRCPMIECEIEYVDLFSSDRCKKATRKYCKKENAYFVNQCTKAAHHFPDIYDISIDPAGFQSPCAVCADYDDEIDGETASTPLSAEDSLQSHTEARQSEEVEDSQDMLSAEIMQKENESTVDENADGDVSQQEEMDDEEADQRFNDAEEELFSRVSTQQEEELEGKFNTTTTTTTTTTPPETKKTTQDTGNNSTGEIDSKYKDSHSFSLNPFSSFLYTLIFICTSLFFL